ncbi:MAG: hypothetical protein O7B99_05360 [Planctomycetota bacterium]|nr:hypothetical protein [Planctomycetota bacterium]
MRLLAAALLLSAGTHTSAPVPAPAALPVPDVPDVIEDFYANGTVKVRYTVDEKGRKDGAYTEFWKNGELRLRARYRAGELDGPYATFYEDGSKHVYTGYARGKLKGKLTERRPDGSLRRTETYDKHGLLDGIRELYAERRVKSRQKWKDGVLVEIDGVVPYPRELDFLRAGLEAIYAVEASAPADDDGDGSAEGDVTGERSGEELEAEALDADRAAGLRRLRAYRFLAELAYQDTELDDTFNFHCQWAAKILFAIGRLDHHPENPGWPEQEYQDAYRGTSRSNLASSGSIPYSVDMYMDDSDPSNIDRIGHRLHCLAPALKKTGFGAFDRYSAMWSMDRSRGKVPDWDVICYPSRGYMPVEYFGERHAWSITFKRRPGRKSELDVKIWALDEILDKVEPPLELDHLGITGRTLVFRPAHLDLTPGNRYRVEISGLKGGKRDGPFMFLVEFVDLGE